MSQDENNHTVEEPFTFVHRDTVPGAEPGATETLDQRQKRILSWLNPTEYDLPGNDYKKHLGAYVPGTGQWVDQYPAYRSWLGSAGDKLAVGKDTDSGVHIPPPGAHGASCLYVRGVAGSGKSVFAASIIQQLQEAGQAVLFFFFRQIVDKNHAAKYLVRDLAAQMMLQSDGLTVTGLLDKLSSQGAVQYMSDKLWSTVLNCTTDGTMGKRTFIVVDALDEMDDADFSDTMQKLLELGSANPEILKVMFTARPLPKIERAIQGKRVSQMKLDPVLLRSDVAKYVESRLARLQPPLSSEKTTLVTKAICDRANGLFLHARLVADNLSESLQNGHVTEETLPDSLERLPRSLSDVYEELLRDHSRRSGVSVDHQAKLLACVTHSSCPLRLIQLGSLMAQMLKIELREGKDLVRASCGGLLELLPDESVSIIHHSFTEFLHDQSRESTENAFPVLDDALAHDMLAAICLEYLDTCPHPYFEVDAAVDGDVAYGRYQKSVAHLRLEYPLAEYAANNFMYHLDKSGNPPSGLGLAAVDAHLAVGHAAFENWGLIKAGNHWGLPSSPLHILLDVFICDPLPLHVVEHMLDAKPDLLDSQEGSETCTPLMLAVTQYDRLDVTRLLLSRGAKMDLKSKDGEAALHRAAKHNSVEGAKALLEAGADPLAKATPRYEGQYAKPGSDTALHMAMYQQNTDMQLAFLPYLPAEAVAQSFHHANDPAILEAALKTGLVDINSDCPDSVADFGGISEPRLWKAARAGRLDLIKTLLDHGASVTRPCTDCPTPLLALTGPKYKRWEETSEDKDLANEIVQRFVETGVDVNAKAVAPPSRTDNSIAPAGSTALHLAVDRGKNWDHSSVTLSEALLRKGADVNATNDDGDAPVHRIEPEHPRLLKVLAEYRPDMNVRNAAGRSPLLEAVYRLAPHLRRNPDPCQWNEIEEFFQCALELGADVQATDDKGNNIMHYVMYSIGAFDGKGAIPVLELLLRHVDVGSKNQDGEAPIFWYKRGEPCPELGNDGLSLLVKRGVRLDGKDRNGLPLLQHLLKYGNIDEDDMKQLIQLGADPTCTGPDGKSLFYHAARMGKKQELLEYLVGIDSIAQAVDEDGDTIIHAILSHVDDFNNAESLKESAISAGANPLAANKAGQTALHVVQPELCMLVLEDDRFRELSINIRDADQRTPLHCFAAGRCNDDVVAEMLERGADPFAKDAAGLTPLHCSAKVDDPTAAGLLLAQFGSKDAALQGANALAAGFSPLHYACEAGFISTVDVLLRAGADPNLASETGLMPLHMLTKYEPPPIVARVDTIRQTCETPDIVYALHKYGAQLDATVDGDVTALDLAVAAKRWEIVRELIACGATVKDHHKTSQEFQLATDKDLALEAARKTKVALDAELAKLSDQEREKRRYYHRPYPTRWPAMSGKAPEKAVCWILGAESLQDFHDMSDDVEGAFADKGALVNVSLDENDFDTIKEYHEQGGDVQQLSEEGGRGDVLNQLVQMGRLNLLHHFAQYRQNSPASQGKVQSQDKGEGRTINDGYAGKAVPPAVTFTTGLVSTTLMREAPSMHILEWLVEDIGLDIHSRPTTLHSTTLVDWPIHIVAAGKKFWHLEALEYLLSKGIDVHQRNDAGFTPILSAFDGLRDPGPWNTDAAQLLLKYGANIEDRVAEAGGPQSGMGALQLAQGRKAIQFLVANGADVKQAAGALIDSIPVLMNVETVTALLDAGMDVNEQPRLDVATAVLVDEKEADEGRVAETGEGKGEKEDETDDTAYSEQDEDALFRPYDRRRRHFALHYAGMRYSNGWRVPPVYETQLELVQLLMSRGADPFAKYADGSFVLQHLIEHRGMATQCVLVFDDACKAKINTAGKHGRTALIQACIAGDRIFSTAWYTSPWPDTKHPKVMADVIIALVLAGADVSLTDNRGRTALHWICTQQAPFDEEVQAAFELLLEKDKSLVHAADGARRTPLNLALQAYTCKPGMDFAIRALLAAGAKPSEISDPTTGDSALHLLARRMAGFEDDEIAQARELFFEIAKTVDINSVNRAGETVAVAAFSAPLTWCAESPDVAKSGRELAEAIAMMHSQLGMKLDYLDDKGRNLLHVIAERHLPVPWDDDYAPSQQGVAPLFLMAARLGVDPRKEDDALRTPVDVAKARDLWGVMQSLADPEFLAVLNEELEGVEDYKGEEEGQGEDDKVVMSSLWCGSVGR